MNQKPVMAKSFSKEDKQAKDSTYKWLSRFDDRARNGQHNKVPFRAQNK